MIGHLSGTVAELSGRGAVIDVGGVGYLVTCTRRLAEALEEGTRATVIVHTDVREDGISLFGFADRLEKQVFLLLTEVKGVGVKSASDIVSRVDRAELLRAIGNEDVARLTAVKGIGKKTAERILVELRDKVTGIVEELDEERGAAPRRDVRPTGAAFEEAAQALRALGFGQREAERMVTGARATLGEGAGDTASVVKEALRHA